MKAIRQFGHFRHHRRLCRRGCLGRDAERIRCRDESRSLTARGRLRDAERVGRRSESGGRRVRGRCGGRTFRGYWSGPALRENVHGIPPFFVAFLSVENSRVVEALRTIGPRSRVNRASMYLAYDIPVIGGAQVSSALPPVENCLRFAELLKLELRQPSDSTSRPKCFEH